MTSLHPRGFMRALRLTKAEESSTLSLSFTAEQPIPSPPPGHLLVKVHASAIQPSDIFNAQGGFSSTTFPRVPGRDFSGVIVGSGDDESSPLLNTAVFGTSGFTHGFTADGFHAEYAVVPVDGIAPKPPHLSHVQAATVGVPFTTAALMVTRSGAAKGDAVLILGAHGAVGSAASIMLENIGCHVLRGVRGTSGDIDTDADPGLLSVQDLTGGKGVDVVIDTVGLPAMTSAAIDNALGHGGKLVFIAAPKGPDPTLTIKMRDFYRAEKSLFGVNSVDHTSASMAKVLRELESLFESGRWKQAVDGKWAEVDVEKAVDVYLHAAKGDKFVINFGE
ncbi:chaperonin 10-like protein [Dactylonectria macrodidyma]|uniref:Chaperonin 10-like protein n=1 Tax=Dactylonectria macrodidyma TaxID=307937 RepID=A0A9P9EWY4_9HYPO|nr:chaperonin 10-like protein [Dactylonectria macrodidyma]